MAPSDLPPPILVSRSATDWLSAYTGELAPSDLPPPILISASGDCGSTPLRGVGIRIPRYPISDLPSSAAKAALADGVMEVGG